MLAAATGAAVGAAAFAGAPNVVGATPLIGGYPNGVADGFAPSSTGLAARDAEEAPKTEGAFLLIIG